MGSGASADRGKVEQREGAEGTQTKRSSSGGSDRLGGGGFRVIRVNSGSPAEAAGLESFFDFITQIDDLSLRAPTQETLRAFVAKVNRRERPLVHLRVFNARRDTWRAVSLRPAPVRRERGEGVGGGDEAAADTLYSLGLSVAFYTSCNCVQNEGLRVLSLSGSTSPAAIAGLQPMDDWILADQHHVFGSVQDFVESVKAKLRRPLQLCVYNKVSDRLRSVTVVPDDAWGGEGSVGCELGVGYLHRLPCYHQPSAAAIEAPAAATVAVTPAGADAAAVPVAHAAAAEATAEATAAATASQSSAEDAAVPAAAASGRSGGEGEGGRGGRGSISSSRATTAAATEGKGEGAAESVAVSSSAAEQRRREAEAGTAKREALGEAAGESAAEAGYSTRVEAAATATAAAKREEGGESSAADAYVDDAVWRERMQKFPPAAYAVTEAAEAAWPSALPSSGPAFLLSDQQQEAQQQEAAVNGRDSRVSARGSWEAQAVEENGEEEEEEEEEEDCGSECSSYFSFPLTTSPLRGGSFFAALPGAVPAAVAAAGGGAFACGTFCGHYAALASSSTAGFGAPSSAAAAAATPQVPPASPSGSAAGAQRKTINSSDGNSRSSGGSGKEWSAVSKVQQQQGRERKARTREEQEALLLNSSYLAYSMPHATAVGSSGASAVFADPPYPGEIFSMYSIC